MSGIPIERKAQNRELSLSLLFTARTDAAPKNDFYVLVAYSKYHVGILIAVTIPGEVPN
jgi:hypothetical protein